MAIVVDPTTNGDFVTITSSDSNAGWSGTGEYSMGLAVIAGGGPEGSAALESRIGPGIGYASYSDTRSLENTHIRVWMKLAQSTSSAATWGTRIHVGTNTNQGNYSVYSDTKQVVVYNGWMMMVADPVKPYTGTIGTAPSNLTGITSYGMSFDYVDGNGKTLTVIDALYIGNTVSIEGGTTGARGTFAEWSADDVSNGDGILRDVGGVYYLNAGVIFQGTGTSDSYFEDTNALVIFEDLSVSGSLYNFTHVGNSTGINHFQLGTSTGSGLTLAGAGGGVLQSAGEVPFRITAIDANVDAVNYYGVTMLGPTAIYSDALRNVKIADGAAFTDITGNANGGPSRTDQVLMPATQALNDATYFGHNERFYALNLNLVTAKGGTWTGTWEYFNGSTWASLTDVTDGTSNFATTGAQTVDYSIPDDWAATAVNSDTRYWIRFRISAFTSSGTNPTQESNTSGTTVDMAGDIRWEDPACDLVGGSITGMGSIRLRNGAFLKSITIDSSRAPSKHAAIDLGSVDPALNTFRDVTIQNCTKGVLLKGTGDTTYNFRNIVFTSNTNDVRVDFGSGDTVTINILEGGTSPSIDNVNGSTVNVVLAPVTTSILVKDNTGTVLQNTRVYLEASDGTGALPFNDSISISVTTTVATVTHSGHGLLTSAQVQISGANQIGYNGAKTITVTDANTYTYTVTNDGAATGTTTATGILINGLTSAAGLIEDTRSISLAQPISGWARKSSVDPFFKSFPIEGTISTTVGLSVNIQMILDQ